MKCEDCKKEIEVMEAYRCRVCHQWYCKDCSLDHFGLQEKGNRVVPRNVLYSFFWNLHKKFWRKD